MTRRNAELIFHIFTSIDNAVFNIAMFRVCVSLMVVIMLYIVITGPRRSNTMLLQLV